MKVSIIYSQISLLYILTTEMQVNFQTNEKWEMNKNKSFKIYIYIKIRGKKLVIKFKFWSYNNKNNKTLIPKFEISYASSTD